MMLSNPFKSPVRHTVWLARAVAAGISTTPWLAIAHDGHGLTGAHGHATDGWGLAAFGLAVCAAVWAARK